MAGLDHHAHQSLARIRYPGHAGIGDERHDRSASAELVIRFATRLRDMGSYDVYEPELEVSQTTTAESGFEPCLAGAIPALFSEDRRSARGEAWNQAVQITARIQ